MGENWFKTLCENTYLLRLLHGEEVCGTSKRCSSYRRRVRGQNVAEFDTTRKITEYTFFFSFSREVYDLEYLVDRHGATIRVVVNIIVQRLGLWRTFSKGPCVEDFRSVMDIRALENIKAVVSIRAVLVIRVLDALKAIILMVCFLCSPYAL